MFAKNLRVSKLKVKAVAWFWQIVVALPVSLPAATAVFGCVAIALLLIGQLRNELVWPIGLVLSILTAGLVTRSYKTESTDDTREQRAFVILVLIGVVAWTGWNTLYTSQNVYVYRDPAIYTVTGTELIDNNDLHMTSSSVFGNHPDVKGDSGAFRSLTDDSERIYPQGLHLLPALLGLAGRIGGEAFMLHINPLFGGLALLAVYGLARVFIKPRWAAFTVLGFSLMLPLIYFSRDTYTEPLAAALAFGALSLIYLAQKNRDKALWFLGGIVGGAGTLVRVDAYLVVAGLIAFAWIYLALAKREDKKARLAEILWFQSGLAITSVIGWLDVTQLSALYYSDLRRLILHQVILMAAALLCGIVLVVIAWNTNLIGGWLNRKTYKWRAFAAVATMIAGVAALLSRPLWYKSYTEGPSTFLSFLANLQAAEGQPVEPRNYIEQSANWVWWYTGPFIALLGVVGLGIALYYLANGKRRYMIMLPFIVVFGVTAVTYLINPSIAPDQIWAVRRFLPIIFPGLLIFATLALQRFINFISKRGLNTKTITTITITLFLAAPVYISYPFIRTRSYTPLLSQVNDVCNTLPEDAAVLLVGTLSYNMTQTIRTYCDVPAERLTEPSIDALKQAAIAAKAAGLNPIILVDGVEKTILPEYEQLTEVGSITYSVVASSLYHPPRSEVKNNRSIYLGKITSSGNIIPIPSLAQ